MTLGLDGLPNCRRLGVLNAPRRLPEVLMEGYAPSSLVLMDAYAPVAGGLNSAKSSPTGAHGS